ncbi:MAG TPA: methyltransferase domain-containing protein [Flavobacterium sp.]|uniref:methyltransferase domain-containing protein n=1 Tax=Flavobacterium sp. TaxID=239 RepID=UPI002CBC99BB|nr:methyltransferase domain-containing protein [Flavobacterium sp.]HNP31655.1 methyltransferase domain-containing protein [Flavobacterium sp.]
MNVIYYSQPDNAFSDLYITVRKKENRFYSEEEIKNLPNIQKEDPNYAEWQLRKKSSNRFISYLKGKNKPLKIMEIGCGNGWFSHLMSTIEKTQVTGLDVTVPELEQAARIFEKENLNFVYADIFEETQLNEKRFDIIVFNSSIQYFKDLLELFKIVKELLSENGEIHIIDSPFYEGSEIEEAKKRTQNYYLNLGFPEMSKNYFHHRIDSLGKHKIMYNPFSFLNHFRKDSPFYWVLIKSD